ncbi:hypothetical protein RHECNPAF_470034 [Rhizobium etli CNPAF512]|nr:hypothetical protein RHECNPAF_470034 [Rhizobium etli CNPAF512]
METEGTRSLPRNGSSLAVAVSVRCIQGFYGDGCNDPGQHDPGKTDNQSQNSRRNMFGREVAVTDGKACHEGKIKRFIDTPILDAPNCKAGCHHDRHDAGKDRPDHTKLLCERDEEQPSHLPGVRSAVWSLLFGTPQPHRTAGGKT